VILILKLVRQFSFFLACPKKLSHMLHKCDSTHASHTFICVIKICEMLRRCIELASNGFQTTLLKRSNAKLLVSYRKLLRQPKRKPTKFWRSIERRWKERWTKYDRERVTKLRHCSDDRKSPRRLEYFPEI